MLLKHSWQEDGKALLWSCCLCVEEGKALLRSCCL